MALHPPVDFVVRDRGEFALPLLLKNISDENLLPTIKKITYKKPNETEVYINPDLYPYMDLKDLPFPFYDIFPKLAGNKLRYIRQTLRIGCLFMVPFAPYRQLVHSTQTFPRGTCVQGNPSLSFYYGLSNIYLW